MRGRGQAGASKWLPGKGLSVSEISGEPESSMRSHVVVRSVTEICDSEADTISVTKITSGLPGERNPYSVSAAMFCRWGKFRCRRP